MFPGLELVRRQRGHGTAAWPACRAGAGATHPDAHQQRQAEADTHAQPRAIAHADTHGHPRPIQYANAHGHPHPFQHTHAHPNTDPTPVSPTIVDNGEDDYLMVDFANPVAAVGFELLTNKYANETITLFFSDGTPPMDFGDSALGTNVNAFEFVGFRSDAPIASVKIDTTGGASQNEGIAGIWVTDHIDIDIKPGSYPNCFNVNGHGVIPVAILGSDTFDVTQINVGTLSFAGLDVAIRGKDRPLCSVQDVSGDFTFPEGAPDGYYDLVCQFEDVDGAFVAGDGFATVTGNLYDGTPFMGSDEICIRPAE
jgi:hypothetical protein